ncbi:MAG: hypothetical protein ACEPOZ_22095, partial [Marinifilaceae bacterium]
MKKLLLPFFIACFNCFLIDASRGQIVSPLGDTTICKGSSVVLEADDSYLYNWSTGELSRTITVSPNVTTSYDLRVFIPDRSIEMIQNGDFSQGNTGFSSEYGYVATASSSALWDEGKYAVGTNPNNYHSNFSSCSDYIGPAPDNMMIINGAPDEGVEIWSQTINVIPNTYYAFSTWFTSVHPDNPAELQFSIDGVLMGAPFKLSGTTCEWEEFYALWHSGSSTTADISIVNKNTIRSGNDYALDGISFNELKEIQDSRLITVIEPPSVNAGNDISVCEHQDIVLSGIATNYTSLQWTSSGDGVFNDSTSLDAIYTPGNGDKLVGSVFLSLTANPNSPCDPVSDQMQVTLTSAPSVDLGADQYFCGTGVVLLDAQNVGGSYLWNTGATSQSISVSTSGSYSVEVMFPNGCIDRDTVFFGFEQMPLVDLGPDQAVCAGTLITLDAGNPGASYLWNTGATTQQISVFEPGDYSVTVTNVHGCSSTDEMNLSWLPNPMVDLGPNQELASGGSIVLDAGKDVVSYLWNDGSVDRWLTVDQPGVYSVRVTDSNGCTAIDMVTVSDGSAFPPQVSLGDTIICEGNSVDLDAGSGFLFNWNTGDLTGKITVAPTETTTYSLRVFEPDESNQLIENGDFSNGNTGFDSDYFYCDDPLNVPCGQNKNIYTVNSNTQVLGGGFVTCSGVTGDSPDNVMIVKGAEANYTVWEQTVSVDPDSYYAFSVFVTNLHSNSYDEFLVRVNGMVVDRFYTNEPCEWDKFQSVFTSGVAETMHLSIENISTSGVGNGYGLDGFQLYKLTETGVDVTVEVVNTPLVNAGSDLSVCSTNSVSLSGAVSNSSSFEWSSSGDGSFSDPTLLTPNYNPGPNDVLNGFVNLSLTAQPTTPCLDPVADVMVVSLLPGPDVNLGIDRGICYGEVLQLDAGNLGVSYLWNDGSTNQTLVVSTSGTYSVTVTDANGCTASDEVVITVNSNPVVSLGADQAFCEGNSAILDAGNVGSTYLWSDGTTNQTLVASASGTYDVRVT